ncbi:MAG: histidine kinase dimerization/phosphoacceptor domain-containing protein, partial [Nostocoides sp.]
MRLLRGERNADPGSDIPFVTLFFAGIWLVYLFDPISQAWAIRHTTRGIVGLAAVVAFAGVYLWHFYRARAYSWGPYDSSARLDPRPQRLIRYAVHVALSMTSIAAIGQQGTTTWVFLAVAGLWTFSMPVAFGLAAALGIAYELLAYHLSGWDRDSSVSLSIALAVFAVGGGMIASRRQRDLSAVRRENARLMVKEERNRMARDLHDILGHSLTVITVKAELAGRLIEVAPERAKAEIE